MMIRLDQTIISENDWFCRVSQNKKKKMTPDVDRGGRTRQLVKR